MMFNRKRNFLLFLLYFLSVNLLLTGNVFANEGEDFTRAWEYLSKDQFDDAEKIISKYIDYNNVKEGWFIAQSVFYLSKEDFERCLNTLNVVRRRMDVAYSELGKSINSKSEIDLITFFYYKLLINSSISNLNLGNFEEANLDYLILVRDFQEYDYYRQIAICYYKMFDLENSLNYFKKSYFHEIEQTVKVQDAYNIASIYALKGQVDEAITWVKIPFGHDLNLWCLQLQSDKDFEKIKQTQKFESFLNQYECNKAEKR